MKNVQIRLLPFSIGRFKLKDPGDDNDRNRAMGVRLRDYTRATNVRWRSCSGYPENDISVFRLELHDAGKIVGTFMPYGCTTMYRSGDVRHISAMLAPVLASEMASEVWIEDVTTLMRGFLEKDLKCDDQTYLSVDEWRFPLEARGDPAEQEWFCETSGYADRLPDFLAEMGRQGVLVEIDEKGIPDRATLAGGSHG